MIFREDETPADGQILRRMPNGKAGLRIYKTRKKVVLHCNGHRIQDQAKRRGNRRTLSQTSVIIGAPSYPSHLPEAEPILPGHTLIRPSLGMLKSAVKFPHRELEGGSGVYGHWDNLGIRYDGRNERVLYSGFRRSNSNAPILVFLPVKSRSHKHKNSKSRFENEYLSKEIRKSKPDNRGDEFLLLMPKDLNLEDTTTKQTKQSLRRQKLNTRINQNKETLTRTYIEEAKDGEKQEKLYEIITKNGEDEYDEGGFEFDDDNNVDPLLQVEVHDAYADTHKPKSKEERKQEWLMETKEQGDHIIYEKSAPNFKDFFPNYTKHNNDDLEGVQNWWYFNQAYLTKLSLDRRHDKDINPY